MRYKVIYERERIRFQELVEKYLNAGWSLAGGVSIKPSSVGDYFYFVQAIYRPYDERDYIEG